MTDFIFAARRHNIDVSYYSFPISNIPEELRVLSLMESKIGVLNMNQIFKSNIIERNIITA